MRATPYAIPFTRPLLIGGVEVPAHRGLLVEHDGGGLGAAVVLPLAAAEDWSRVDATAAACETAQLDAAARAAGVRLAEALGGVRRTRIALNALLVERDAAACAAEAAARVAEGFRCLKLKLAPRDSDGERRRLAAVRAAVGAGVALRADANAAWTVDEAIAFLRQLAPFGLEYVEQPVAGIAELVAVRRAAPMPIAADEAAQDLDAVEHVIAANAADVIVLKPALLGLRASLAAAARAQAAGIGVVVTSALDSGVGIAAAAHVAAAIEGDVLACGLATGDLLAGDLVRDGLTVSGGELLLPDGPGLGVEIDPQALGRLQSGASFSIGASSEGDRRAWSRGGVEPPCGRLAGGTPAATRRLQPTATRTVVPAASRTVVPPATWTPLPTTLRTAAPAGRAVGALPWVDQRAVTHGERTALVSGATALSFAALQQRAAAASARLAAYGVGRGARVGLLLGDRLQFAVWLHGVTRLGAVAVPLGERLPAAELERQLRTCRCDALVSDAATARVARAVPAQWCGQRIDAADIASDATSAAAPLEFEAPHTVVFTSGSSGAPKGVVLTNGNHYWSALGSALALGLRDDDRWLACLPPHHVGGLAILLRGIIGGVPVVLHERFDAAAVHEALEAQRITLLSLVPAMLQRLLETRGARPFPTTLRRVLLGGAPAPRALCAAAAARGVPLAVTYGMTEAASQLVTDGRPLLGVQVRIRGGDGSAARPDAWTESVEKIPPDPPFSKGGIVEVRGPMLSPGVFGGDGEWHPHGEWLATNDLGAFDADGRLRVLGRADDVIISGGENVHPREVEEALEAHPSVAEACVFGLPDPTWGEIVAAEVRLRDGVTSAAPLTAHARRLLAPAKLPRRIEAVADFPRSAAGKILRRAVREAALGR